MSTTVDIEALMKLSVAEKLKVVDALIDSIMDARHDLTPEQLAEMERRLDWAIANPEKCGTYEEYKTRIREMM